MIEDVRAGARYRSVVCETEVIVIRAASSELDLRCGGHPMVTGGATAPAGSEAEPGFDGGTQIGKRYADEGGEIELLCIRGGASSLSLGATLLDVKEAKPLPSSD